MTDTGPEQYGNVLVLGDVGAGKTCLQAEIMKTLVSGDGDKSDVTSRNGDTPLNLRGEANDEK